ncbi:MAG: TonB-dependent receptor [Pseudohongiellaceae bacterium]
MNRSLITWTTALLCSGSLHSATAQEQSNLEEVLVLGSNLELNGNPVNATEGVVYDLQLATRPVGRPGELLEFVPGLIATQHSGEGKGNQYFMRGFNLDHGTDLAIQVDGLPVNMPTHGHGHGYADLNFLIPELIDTLRYRKGPYYADAGDFATAGSADFEYLNRLDEGTINLTIGEEGYQRVYAGETLGDGRGAFTLAGALTRYDGPWELDQDMDKRQGLLRYHHDDGETSWRVTGAFYDNTWQATDQIPQRAVDAGQLGRWGTVDDSDGGETHRHSLSADWSRQYPGDRAWEGRAYYLDYGLDLYSNFTYFLEHPERGDQFHQEDSRHVMGLESRYRQPVDFGDIPGQLDIGFQVRSDDIDVGLHWTERREHRDTVRTDHVDQSMNSLYGQLDQQWHPDWRTVASLRLDHYRYDVTAGTAVNSGSGTDTLISPAVNVIYSPQSQTEYFLSAGRGFHSNDARGAVISTDPASGEPVDTIDPMAAADSVEIGLRSSILPRMRLSATAFLMDLESELIYVGDAGNTEALNPSRRYGAEFGALWSPTSWLLVDGDVTFTRARLRHAGNEDRIPNAVNKTASLGLSLDGGNGLTGGLQLRYLGDAPLTESGSPRSPDTFLVNARGSWQMTSRLNLSVELINALDQDEHDITYFYESQLAGETTPAEDIHFHPAEPRMFRVTLQARL